jgi:AraC-like DNA-binding protein
MKLNVKYDMNVACKAILKEQVENLNIAYKSISLGEIEFKESITSEQLEQLNAGLSKYGIEIIDSQKNALIQKTKDVIIEMIYREENLPSIKISDYISNKVNYSYGYLSTLFSEITYSSIENFIILQKIERAKQLILAEDLSLTEIAYRLSYSSVAHLSAQFKKTTGLTPSAFQSIIKKRRAKEFT